jgi:DNA invertase Pin-like site-specific DNA recombinase
MSRGKRSGPKVAAYVRVSKDEQDPELQLREVREYVERRGWSADEFVDRGESGAKERRPEFDRLVKELRRRRYSAVVVWRFDRAARSLRQLLQLLEELRQLGTDFVSVTEAIDTSTISGKAMFGMVAVFAEFERDVLRERVKAGLAKARANGVRLGRPRAVFDLEAAKAFLRRGESQRAVARRFGVDHATLCRALRRSRVVRNPTPKGRRSRPRIHTT